MKMTREEIIVMIKDKMDGELECAKKTRWIMNKTFSPFRKLKCYHDEKRFMDHVFAMDLILQGIKTREEES